VQLIDASSFWVPMRKSLGNKRREISAEQIQAVTKIYEDFKEGEYSRIFNTTDFGYRKITVERPMRLNFQASPERIERLNKESAFANLTVSKKKNPLEKVNEEYEGRKQQEAILAVIKILPDTLFKDRTHFEKALNNASKAGGLKLGW
jgi:type I restriction enzyme M protein